MSSGMVHITLGLLPPITTVLFTEWLSTNLDKLLRTDDMVDREES